MKSNNKRSILALCLLFSLGLSSFSAPIKGKITDGKKGISGIVVSDGYTVTTSDKKGNYTLNGNDSAKFVFITIPADYEIPNKGNIPQFYRDIKGVKDAVTADFQLKKKKKDTDFVLTVMADPQSQIEADMGRFTTEAIPDLEQLRQTYSANTSFVGLTVGDLVWDAPQLYPAYVEAFKPLSYPFFQTIGNHDHDEKITGNDYEASHNYEKHLGPTYYSFDRGDCHFIVLDNIIYNTRKKYEEKISRQQLEWLKQDISHVAKDKLIIVGMHAPAFVRSGRAVTTNSDRLFALLEGYQTLLLSGHSHRMNKTDISNRIVEYTLSATMGNSWAGDICNNGCPNGYGVFEIKGNKLSNYYYKSLKQDRNHQMRLYPIGHVPEKPGSVVAHVWNFSKGWKVEVFENGVSKGEMKSFSGVDPLAYEVFFGPEKPKRKPKLEPTNTHNLFYYTPVNKQAEITVIVTDNFGNSYTGLLSNI